MDRWRCPSPRRGRGRARGRAAEGLRGGRRGGPGARRCRASSSPPASSPRSWGRRARASRRCCTAWPASTRRPTGRSSSATSTSRTLSEKQLTLLRRDQVGFVFQAFNLVPTLTAAENITLPLDIAGRKPDQAWFDTVVDTVGLRDRLDAPARASSRAGSSSASPARGRSSRRPEIVFADEPTGQPGLASRAPSSSGSCASAVDDHGQTIVMVTHDANAASYADRVVFLADGRIVDEMLEPTRRARARPPEVAGGLSRVPRDRSRASWRGSSGSSLTALSIVLGVGFMAGTFVLTDTMNAAFDELFAQTSPRAATSIVRATRRSRRAGRPGRRQPRRARARPRVAARRRSRRSPASQRPRATSSATRRSSTRRRQGDRRRRAADARRQLDATSTGVASPRRAGRRRARRGRDRRRHGEEDDLKVGDSDHDPVPGPAERVHDRRASPGSATRTTSRARRSALFDTADRPGACSARQGEFDAIAVVADAGRRRRRRCSTRISRCCRRASRP